MLVKLPLPMLKVHIRQGSGPKGPLTAREIKDRVTAEYEQVSVTRHVKLFCHSIYHMWKFCTIDVSLKTIYTSNTEIVVL